MASMEYLFDHLDGIEEQMGYRKPIMLLDYDGTLTPIVQSPDLAVLGEGMLSVLTRLRDNQRFVIGVISGRSLSDVKSKVELDGIWYAGNHGMEIEYQDDVFVHPQARRSMPLISRICSRIKPLLVGYEGALIEDKGLTASVHYRMVAEHDIPEVKRVVESAIRPFSENGEILLTHGKMVLEIRPNVRWDKGRAVLWLLKTMGAGFSDEYLVVYVGDDRTDEDAFEVVRGRGIAVMVSSEDVESKAEYVLSSVDDVQEFLDCVANLPEE
ncbi:MAG: trehalose-phosphatase [Thermoplasmata archaeon]